MRKITARLGEWLGQRFSRLNAWCLEKIKWLGQSFSRLSAWCLEKIKRLGKFFINPFFKLWSIPGSILLLLLLVASETFAGLNSRLAKFLGFVNENPKQEIIRFLGITLGGVLLVIQIWHSNRRATAAEKNAETAQETAKNSLDNRIQEQLKAAVEHLGHRNPVVVRSAMFELFRFAQNLQQQNHPEFADACEFLCSFLVSYTTAKKYQHANPKVPAPEIQYLLDLLFKPKTGQDPLIPKGQVNFEGVFLHGVNHPKARQDPLIPKGQVKLQGVFLHGVNLEDAELQSADLSDAKLRYANLYKAQLQGARLSDAQLRDAKLHSAQLWGAKLDSAQLQDADLSEAQLRDADLRFAQLQGADLRHAQLQRADLSDAKLRYADLRFAELQGARLSDAQLQHAYLVHVQLQGADLSHARLQAANLRGAQLWGANLSNAQLQGAYLYQAQLQGADLSHAKLKGAELGAAQFQGAELSKTQMQGVSCAEKLEDMANHERELIEEILYFSFEKRILGRADQESDFSTVVFKGGLKQKDIERIKNKLQPYLDKTKLAALTKKLKKHVDKEPSNTLPEGVEKGKYTEGQAKEWIAKYEAAMLGQDEDF